MSGVTVGAPLARRGGEPGLLPGFRWPMLQEASPQISPLSGPWCNWLFNSVAGFIEKDQRSLAGWGHFAVRM